MKTAYDFLPKEPVAVPFFQPCFSCLRIFTNENEYNGHEHVELLSVTEQQRNDFLAQVQVARLKFEEEKCIQ